MGYKHVITIAHDALLLLEDKDLGSSELAKVAEQIGKDVLTACLTVHREHRRWPAGDHLIAPIGAHGGTIFHIGEPYKADLRTYIFEGNANAKKHRYAKIALHGTLQPSRQHQVRPDRDVYVHYDEVSDARTSNRRARSLGRAVQHVWRLDKS